MLSENLRTTRSAVVLSTAFCVFDVSPAAMCHQRLKRVFAIEIEKCERCGGKVKIIACIEDPVVTFTRIRNGRGDLSDEKVYQPMT